MSTKLIVPAVAYKKKGDGKELYYGKGAYIALCYAKFKKTWFTSKNFRDFQMNKPKIVRDSHEYFRNLVKWGYLEKTMVGNTAHFRITRDGEHALYALAERQKKKLLKQVQANGSIGGMKRAAQTL